jgi:hypothetical protein
VTGKEGASIPIPDLTATLVDDAVLTHMKKKCQVMRNVPENSLFSAGSNNGDGSWTIPADSLSSRDHTARVLCWNHDAHVCSNRLELSNGDEATICLVTVTVVTPIADDSPHPGQGPKQAPVSHR